MWGSKKEDTNFASPAAARDLRPMGPAAVERPGLRPNSARLGRSLSVKGELVGNEELYVDAEFDGTIDLGESSLTVGPQGRVQADVRAREIVVEGTVRGNLRAADRLQISRTGNVVGDLVAARIVIEDGAYFKGSIDIQKPGEQAQPPRGRESLRVTPVAASPEEK